MEFRLGGQDYNLTREDVEERLKHIEPEDVRKHFVTLNGKRYPVKQALAVALGRRVADFITTDAIRVLSNLGFKTGDITGEVPIIKTPSEQQFEKYLRSNGLGYFQYEKELPRTSKRPDYSLTYKGQEILFEVKEFKATGDEVENDGEAHAFDPYRRIREKIGAGRKKFKELEGYCCCLVLYNEEKPLVFLDFPELIMGAMLGDLAIRIPFAPERQGGVPKEPYTVYSAQRGKMLHKAGEQVVVENTTISAVLVLENLEIGQRRFGVEIRRIENEGKKLTLFEAFDMFRKTEGTESDYKLRELRLVVYENPYARNPLPRDIFGGPYDERYGLSDGRITRLYAGAGIIEIEQLEAKFPERRLEEFLREDPEEPNNVEETPRN